MLNKFLKYFEANNMVPRDSQVKVLKTIATNYTKKYFVVSAQTGVGKSHIALSLASASKSAYILTSTKLLQNQYLKIDSGCALIKGKSNYRCEVNPELTCQSATCNTFKSLKGACISSGKCEYYKRLGFAQNSKLFLTNYSYFLFAKHCGPLKDAIPRSVAIFDECHEIESQILSFAEETINPAELGSKYDIHHLDQLKFTDNHGKNLKRLEIIVDLIAERKLFLDEAKKRVIGKFSHDEASFNPKKVPKTSLDKLAVITGTISTLDQLQQKILIYIRSVSNPANIKDWHFHVDLKENFVTISPLTCKYHFRLFMENCADKIVFMSATTGSLNYISSEMGIPKDQICYIDADSDFNPEHSPVVYLPVGKMSYAQIDKTMPGIIKTVDAILTEHASEKGIIHTANYRITEEILKKSKNKARLLGKSQKLKNNEMLIKEHRQNTIKNSVLISPSMVSGVDLYDNLSRFQIICKLPFLPLSNPRIAHKTELDPGWYAEQMLLNILQMSGRSTRSKDDYSITYILDESFKFYVDKYKDRLPKWFLDRLHF